MSIRSDLFNFRCDLSKRWEILKQGYSNVDVWNFDYWFLHTIPPMIDELKKAGNSYPHDMLYTEWQNYLETMSNHFKEAAKYDDFVYDNTLSVKENKEKSDVHFNNCKIHLHEGLKMLGNRFFDMWD